MSKRITLPQGYSLAYDDLGNPNDLCPVFCVHGVLQTRHTFDEVSEFLTNHNRRVIKVDLVGHGESDWSKDPSRYDPAFYAEDCSYLIRSLELKSIDWIGISLGGLVGFQCAAKQGVPIKHFVAVDVAPEVPIEMTKMLADWVEATHHFKTQEEFANWRVACSQAVGPLSDDQRRARAAYDFRQTTGGYEPIYDPSISVNLRKDATKGENYNDWHSFEQMKVPTLLFHGIESGVLTKPLIEKMQSIAKGIQVFHVEGVGHYPALADSKQQKALLRFITPPHTQLNQKPFFKVQV